MYMLRFNAEVQRILMTSRHPRLTRKKDSEASKESTEQNTPVLVGFLNANVVNVEQAYGRGAFQVGEEARAVDDKPRSVVCLHRSGVNSAPSNDHGTEEEMQNAEPAKVAIFAFSNTPEVGTTARLSRSRTHPRRS